MARDRFGLNNLIAERETPCEKHRGAKYGRSVSHRNNEKPTDWTTRAITRHLARGWGKAWKV